jgi:hypothetical protein
LSQFHQLSGAPGAPAVRRRAMTDFLLKRGADPNIGDAYSMTPLHFAASRGDQEVARALLHHGADPDARDYNGDTPLIEAAYRGHEEVVSTFACPWGEREHKTTRQVLARPGAPEYLRRGWARQSRRRCSPPKPPATLTT